MPQSPEPCIIFRDDSAATERRFQNPLEIIEAWDATEFRPALRRLEQARDDGKWLAGYFSYEAGYLLEPKLRPLLPDGRRTPLLQFGVFDQPTDDAIGPLGAPTQNPISDPHAAWTFGEYDQRFQILHRHLRLGDCYQANLTFPVAARWAGEPMDAFANLAVRQPVKYSALVLLGEPTILSRSPELFFAIDDDGWIEAHPMKGTAPRGHTKAEDEAQKLFLQTDEKNQAENRMIVDLLRNDISLVSEVGTLEVPELFRIETYPTVHQMVSRVRAKLLPGLTIERLFAALFPCGSITGAPKIRAMEILRDLEHQPRDAYCGAIGWISPHGPMRFNVAIRTITLFAGGEAVYNVGGGIVFDSTSESEYRECLLKARFATGTEPVSN
ncbi:MAG: aminodeoxychorismate synthase component I [Rhizobiaceae bacterium]